MDPKLNEMDDDYADGGYAPMNPAPVISLPPTPMSVADSEPVDSTIVVGTPTAGDVDTKNITVYANSINPVSYADTAPIVAFDVVFSVGIVCPETGVTETYQVVKRIGVDRMKIACDAKSSTPVSIVEAKKPVSAERFLVSTERARAIAGLK